MITWISTGSYTDCYPVTFGGIQIGEFSVLEEISRQKLIGTIHLIVVRQPRQKKEEYLLERSLHVHRIDKPYLFERSTDTEFRTTFSIGAKKITHQLVLEGKTRIFQLCSVVPARSFLDWDMRDSFDRKKRPKFVYSVHNALTLIDEPQGSFLTKKEEWQAQKNAEIEVIKRADKVICTSHSFQDFLTKKYGLNKNIVSIPNTVGPYEFFRKIKGFNGPQWSKVILFLGRLSKEKRVDLVVETFALLIKMGYDYSLFIVGDGDEKGRIEELIKKTA